MKLRRKAILVFCIFLAGCATVAPIVDVVPEAQGKEPINGLTMTSSSPYKLTQDVSVWTGAKRAIVIDGVDMKVGGNETGTIVVVMNITQGRASNKVHSLKMNNCVDAVRRVFADNGIRILSARPIQTKALIIGYALELDRDGYTVLKKYSKETERRRGQED